MTLVYTRHSSLRKLCLDGEHLTDATYVALAQCEKLTTLEVIFAELMTDEGLMGLMVGPGAKTKKAKLKKFDPQWRIQGVGYVGWNPPLSGFNFTRKKWENMQFR